MQDHKHEYTPPPPSTNNNEQVFIPTDEAFLEEGIDPVSVLGLPESIVKNMLLYHTLNGSVVTEDIALDDTIFTALNVDLHTRGSVLVDSQNHSSNIVEPDVQCSNGYLHIVDSVLMPPDLITSLVSYNAEGGPYEGLFDTLLRCLVWTNITDLLTGLSGPYTVSIEMRQRLSVLALLSGTRMPGARGARAESSFRQAVS